jgi:hypothetical protein
MTSSSNERNGLVLNLAFVVQDGAPHAVSQTNAQAASSDVLSFATLHGTCHETLADSLPEFFARQPEPTGDITGFQDEVAVRVAFDMHRSSSGRWC